MQRLSLSALAWTLHEVGTRRKTPATVPGCVHTDLLAAGAIDDPFFGERELELQWIGERDWEYVLRFRVPSALRACERLELVCDGLDTVATVQLNGVTLGRTDNMFIGYRFDVRAHLKPGQNELRVRFDSALRYVRNERTEFPPSCINDPEGTAPRIRKQQCQFGWDWGPRFITAGIWRDVRLEGFARTRLEALHVAQQHNTDGSVELQLRATLEQELGHCHGVVRLRGEEVASIVDGHALVREPELWWPSGHGAQPLYDLDVTIKDREGVEIERVQRRIGLRVIELDRGVDAKGSRFQFVVNGKPIFAKGANWIPAHAFVAGLTRADYERDLRAAKSAHMNMIRVWGGGIYEHEAFYDLCDELGLLVWQDFMFACTLYPSDPAFLQSVAEEARQQVQRLQHRACLALWCGNNESEQLHHEQLNQKPELLDEYVRLFEQLLPQQVGAFDGITPYWPSSPHRPDCDARHEAGERGGDTHFWDVWHARKPVKEYERYALRFCSEFGMQSYSSPQTNATFCPPDQRNVFGAAMENHQKNKGGNQVILDYVSRRYRLPRGQDELIYLSQLNQAYCMQVGVEHYRRLMPHCMGALYWQLNDCWPVASWSSIEHTGRWRALHHVAKRFFAPALVSIHVPGDEEAGVGNYRKSTVDSVALYAVYDGEAPRRASLYHELLHVDGRVLRKGTDALRLQPGESRNVRQLELRDAIAAHGRERLIVRASLRAEDGSTLSEDSAFLTAPRFVELPRAAIKTRVRQLAPHAKSSREFEITLSSKAFQHRVALDFGEWAFELDDNYFELFANEPRTVRLTLPRPRTKDALEKRLTTRSLADTYVP